MRKIYLMPAVLIKDHAIQRSTKFNNTHTPLHLITIPTTRNLIGITQYPSPALREKMIQSTTIIIQLRLTIRTDR